MRNPIFHGGIVVVTTLYLVRHGETAGSEKRYNGSTDVPLSEKGADQVGEAAKFIADHLRDHEAAKAISYLKDIHDNAGAEARSTEPPGLSAVYCSDLERAKRSAGIIAAPHRLYPVEMPDLRERHFGIWEGMTFTEIRKRYPAEFESWAGDPVRYSPPGGETTQGVKDRVVSALERILGDHRGDNIAIVAHGGVNRIILCHILRVPLENIFRIEQDHAAVNIIEFWDRYPVIKLMNGGKK